MGYYEIIGEQAFTEEGYLIYNIRVDSVLSVSASQVKDHFERYGTILDMRTLEGLNKRKNIFFVHYANPADAAKALLQEKNVYFTLSPFIVRHSDSLYQPDGQRFIANLKTSFGNNGSYETDQEGALILNDDCLEQICKLLSINDQINFALTCKRFLNVLKLLYSCLHTDEIFPELTPFKIRIFLQIVGPEVKNLTIKRLFDNFSLWTVHKFCSSFCTNVEKLKILDVLETKEKLMTLIGKMPLLEELELSYISFNDNIIEHLMTLKKLKCLSITTESNTTFENIEILCNLEKLSLQRCSNLTSFHFKNICTNLKNLYSLDIRHCKNLRTDDFECLAEHLIKLKNLKISCSDVNLNCITQLPHLKQLEITDSTGIADDFFFNLSKFKADQLEELRLNIRDLRMANVSSIAELKKLKVLYCHGNNNIYNNAVLPIFSQLSGLKEIGLISIPFTEAEFLMLLEKCLNLTTIHIKLWDGITFDYIKAAQKLLQQQRTHYLRKDRIELKIMEINGERTDLELDLSDEYIDDRPDRVTDELKISFISDPLYVALFEDDDDHEWEDPTFFDDL